VIALIALLGNAAEPIIIGHRGAPGYLPDHTLASYELAIELGADFIEPDLVSTKDGALIARHENELGDTTDVAEKFPARKTERIIDGHRVTGWFAQDFTLAEIRTLRARQPMDCRDKRHDGQHGVPTFDEILGLIDAHRAKGRIVGVYPETKHPSHHRAAGLPLEDKLVAALQAHDLDRADAPVFIQSFEPSNLRDLAGATKVRLVQLIGPPTADPPVLRPAPPTATC